MKNLNGKMKYIALTVGVVFGLMVSSIIKTTHTFIQNMNERQNFLAELTDSGKPVFRDMRLKDVAAWDSHIWIKMEALKTSRTCGAPIGFEVTYWDGDAKIYRPIESLERYRDDLGFYDEPRVLPLSQDWQSLAWWKILPPFESHFFIHITHECPVRYLGDDLEGLGDKTNAREVISWNYGPYRLPAAVEIKNPLEEPTEPLETEEAQP